MKKLLVVFIALISAAAFAQEVEFTVVNESGRDIHYLLVSPVEADQWNWEDDEMLGEEIIAEGSSGAIRIQSGAYDILAVDEYEDTYTFLEFTIRENDTLIITADDLD
ncbi:MAG: hypothetical protein LBJ31_05020 [Treponema sp.]|jgi:hypothetical protein|nr:hypothetical protein [Treponema sp.]